MTKKRFTLIELLIVVTIISILAAILLPTLFKARDKVKMLQCISSQRQFAMSAILYAKDNEGNWPSRGAVTTNGTGNVFPHQRASRDKDDFDDRDVFADFNFKLYCPFFRLKPSDDAGVSGQGWLEDGGLDICPPGKDRKLPYAFWFGWTLDGIEVNEKMTTPLTYNGETFNLLISDTYIVSKNNWVHANHPDKELNLLTSPWDDNSTDWSNGTNSEHGGIDMNFTRTDGSAFTIQKVVSEDPRLSKVPRKLSDYSIGSNWVLLPSE